MRKILNTTIYTLLLLYLSLGLVYANESEDVDLEQSNISSTHFAIDLELGIQSVWNNSIPLTIYLTPNQDFDSVEIRSTTPTVLEFNYRGEQYFPVRKGETYEIKSRLYPKRKGNYRISITAIAWQYDTNYSSSETIEVTLDENLQIVPQTSEYTRNLVLKYIALTILTIGLGYGAFIGGRHGYKKLKIWLLPEN